MLTTNNVIYKLVCRCNNNYLGRTFHRFGSWLRQHVAKYVTNLVDKRVSFMQKEVIKATHRKALAAPLSDILKHLLENHNCAKR